VRQDLFLWYNRVSGKINYKTRRGKLQTILADSNQHINECKNRHTSTNKRLNAHKMRQDRTLIID